MSDIWDTCESYFVEEVCKLGTGELNSCKALIEKDLLLEGACTQLIRVVSIDEYNSLKLNSNKFIEHEFSMGTKWFAISEFDALRWKDLWQIN